MPEVSTPYNSSPGIRQDDGEVMTNNTLSMTPPCASPPTRPRRKMPRRTTATEAYKKGQLLQYILDSTREFDCFNINTDSTDDYEVNWTGHQPLGDDSPSSMVSASELRLIRSRRRRGVVTPPAHQTAKVGGSSGTIVHEGGELSFGKVHEKLQEPRDLPRCSIPFPEDVVDPHIATKEKWKPNF